MPRRRRSGVRPGLAHRAGLPGGDLHEWVAGRDQAHCRMQCGVLKTSLPTEACRTGWLMRPRAALQRMATPCQARGFSRGFGSLRRRWIASRCIASDPVRRARL